MTNFQFVNANQLRANIVNAAMTNFQFVNANQLRANIVNTLA